MIWRATIAAATAAAFLAGCGGGGGGGATGASLPTAPLGPQMASVQLVLKVPALSSQVRVHQYVSPSTQSVGVSVDSGAAAFTNVTAGSPACNGATAPYSCTITVTAAAGSHSLAFTTYDKPSGAGNALSTNSTTVTFVANQSPSIPLVLNGIPTKITATGGQGFATNAAGGYYMLEGTNQKVTIVALDADNNMIVGPGAPAIAVTPAGGSALTVATPAPNQGNAFTLSDGAFETSSPTLTATEPGANSPAVTTTASINSTTLSSTFSGTVATAGNTDGVATSVQFHYPSGIALAANGNVIVVDRNNCSVRSLTGTGANAGTSTTLTPANACYGSAPTPSSTPVPGGLYHPTGITLDTNNGNYYVADFGHCAIDQVTPAGVVSVIAGTPTLGATFCSESDNPTGSAAAFNYPIAITYDASVDALFVADYLGCTVRKVVPTAPYAVTSIVVLAGGSTGHCTGRLYSSSGNVYTSKNYGRSGRGYYSSQYYSYRANGTATTGTWQPSGIVPDGHGNLYMTDTNRCIIQKVNESTGALSLVAGIFGTCGEVDGSATSAEFQSPQGIAIGNGYLYVADLYTNTIRAVSIATGTVATISGGSGAAGSCGDRLPSSRRAKAGARRHGSSLHAMNCSGHTLSNGWGKEATYQSPASIVFDAANNRLLVTDENNEIVRQILL